MIEVLPEEKHYARLQMALSICSFAPNKEEVFWRALLDLDKEGTVFALAIIAAAKTYDLELLAEEILVLNILSGLYVYNPLETGIFEQVSIQQKGGPAVEFFIYPAF